MMMMMMMMMILIIITVIDIILVVIIFERFFNQCNKYLILLFVTQFSVVSPQG